MQKGDKMIEPIELNYELCVSILFISWLLSASLKMIYGIIKAEKLKEYGNIDIVIGFIMWILGTWVMFG